MSSEKESALSQFCSCDQTSVKEETQHELGLNEGEDIGEWRGRGSVVWMEEHLKENVET